MFKILGVDPGSLCTGFGIIAGEGDDFHYVTSGTIVPGKNVQRYEKLKEIYKQVERVIVEQSPTHFAIENVFYSKNAKSSLVLGEARGVAILAAALAGLPVFEYSAREVKQSVTGRGEADKSQVSFMLGEILDLKETPQSNDESDALAVAICHAFKNREWSLP
jgi:crossover junction endodeoxyribonuclease RuvC